MHTFNKIDRNPFTLMMLDRNNLYQPPGKNPSLDDDNHHDANENTRHNQRPNTLSMLASLIGEKGKETNQYHDNLRWNISYDKFEDYIIQYKNSEIVVIKGAGSDGVSFESNIAHAVIEILEAMAQGHSTFNLLGHGQGAIALLNVAHAIQFIQDTFEAEQDETLLSVLNRIHVAKVSSHLKKMTCRVNEGNSTDLFINKINDFENEVRKRINNIEINIIVMEPTNSQYLVTGSEDNKSPVHHLGDKLLSLPSVVKKYDAILCVSDFSHRFAFFCPSNSQDNCIVNTIFLPGYEGMLADTTVSPQSEIESNIDPDRAVWKFAFSKMIQLLKGSGVHFRKIDEKCDHALFVNQLLNESNDVRNSSTQYKRLQSVRERMLKKYQSHNPSMKYDAFNFHFDGEHAVSSLCETFKSIDPNQIELSKIIDFLRSSFHKIFSLLESGSIIKENTPEHDLNEVLKDEMTCSKFSDEMKQFFGLVSSSYFTKPLDDESRSKILNSFMKLKQLLGKNKNSENERVLKISSELTKVVNDGFSLAIHDHVQRYQIISDHFVYKAHLEKVHAPAPTEYGENTRHSLDMLIDSRDLNTSVHCFILSLMDLMKNSTLISETRGNELRIALRNIQSSLIDSAACLVKKYDVTSTNKFFQEKSKRQDKTKKSTKNAEILIRTEALFVSSVKALAVGRYGMPDPKELRINELESQIERFKEDVTTIKASATKAFDKVREENNKLRKFEEKRTLPSICNKVIKRLSETLVECINTLPKSNPTMFSKQKMDEASSQLHEILKTLKASLEDPESKEVMKLLNFDKMMKANFEQLKTIAQGKGGAAENSDAILEEYQILSNALKSYELDELQDFGLQYADDIERDYQEKSQQAK